MAGGRFTLRAGAPDAGVAVGDDVAPALSEPTETYLRGKIDPTDERVAEGTPVEPGQVLVRRTTPGGRDVSIVCPPRTGGVVSRVAIDDGRVSITVKAERPLAIGDRLQAGDDAFGTVSELGGQGLRWPGRAGEHLVVRTGVAADHLVRHFAKIDLARLMPLLERGAAQTASALTAGRPPLLAEVLFALCLELEVSDTSATLRWADDAVVRAKCPAVLTEPGTYDHDTGRMIEGGLFSVEGRARLELAAPIVHPWCVDLVASLLQRTPKALLEVLDGEKTLEGTAPTTWESTGATAVRAALVAMQHPRRPERFIFEAWPVTPPSTRPRVPLNEGRFATTDLNAIYANAISANARLAAATTLPERLEAMRLLRHAIDSVVDNEHAREPLGEERALKSLVNELVVQLKSVRDGLRVKASASGFVAPVAGLAATTMRVPASLELTTPVLAYVAGTSRGDRFEVEPWNENAFGLAPAAFEALAIGPLDTLQVFAPNVLPPLGTTRAPRPPSRGWLGRAIDARHLPQLLLDVVMREDVDPLTDDETRMLLGLPLH